MGFVPILLKKQSFSKTRNHRTEPLSFRLCLLERGSVRSHEQDSMRKDSFKPSLKSQRSLIDQHVSVFGT